MSDPHAPVPPCFDPIFLPPDDHIVLLPNSALPFSIALLGRSLQAKLLLRARENRSCFCCRLALGRSTCWRRCAGLLLTFVSGDKMSTWLLQLFFSFCPPSSSSFLAASFCAKAELNETFTMAADSSRLRLQQGCKVSGSCGEGGRSGPRFLLAESQGQNRGS